MRYYLFDHIIFMIVDNFINSIILPTLIPIILINIECIIIVCIKITIIFIIVKSFNVVLVS